MKLVWHTASVLADLCASVAGIAASVTRRPTAILIAASCRPESAAAAACDCKMRCCCCLRILGMPSVLQVVRSSRQSHPATHRSSPGGPPCQREASAGLPYTLIMSRTSVGLTGASAAQKQHACPRSCLSIPALGYYALAGVFLRSAAPLPRSAGQGWRKKTANACGERSATREDAPAVAERHL